MRIVLVSGRGCCTFHTLLGERAVLQSRGHGVDADEGFVTELRIHDGTERGDNETTKTALAGR